MSKLLQSAIADAKAVRETALQNARAVLEEAFTPKLQSMLSTKLQQEIAGEEDEEMLEEFESVDNDGTSSNGFMGVDGDVMNEGESGYKSDDHTTDPQGPSKELSSGPSDQDSDSTPNVNTASEGPKAGGKLTPSNTDHSGMGGSKSQIKASDQDANQTPNNDTSSELTISENDDYDTDDEDELNEIIAELDAEIDGGDDYSDEEEISDMSMEEPTDELPVDGGLEGGLEGDDEEIDLDLDDEVEGEESADISVDGVAGDDEEVDLDEILREMELGGADEASDDERYDEMMGQIDSLRRENAEYKEAFMEVKKQLNEVNLLNAKLLYTNKVFKSTALNNDQKMRVVESFDRSRNVREVKLTYANLRESFKIVNGSKKKSSITEGIASKVVKSTKPSAATEQRQKEILAEGNYLASRFQKLAGIKK